MQCKKVSYAVLLIMVMMQMMLAIAWACFRFGKAKTVGVEGLKLVVMIPFKASGLCNNRQ